MKITFPKNTASLLVGAFAILCAPSALFAQDIDMGMPARLARPAGPITPAVPDVLHTWNGPPGSGPNDNWFNANNWLPATVPTSTDNVVINNFGTARIPTNGGPAAAQNVDIGQAFPDVGTLRVVDSGDLVVGNGMAGTLIVGDDGIGHAVFRDDATVADVNGIIGRMDDGLGDVLVRDNAVWTNLNNLQVGDAGGGDFGGASLDIRDAAVVTAQTIRIGNQTNSIGRVDVQGTYMVGTSDFNMISSGNTGIGVSGDGRMNIHDGGRVHTIGNGVIGGNSDGTGVVRVGGDGPNSESFWLIGRPGNAIVGNNAGSDVANSPIAGNNPAGISSVLIVGNDGNGTLNIHDGGFVNVDDGFGNAFIGRNAGSMGRVSIDGSGGINGSGFSTSSTLLANSIFVGGTGAGPGGDGAMRLTNGGTVLANNLTVWGPGTGNKGLLEVDSTYVLNGADFVPAPINITFDGGRLRFLDDTDFINDATLGNTQSPDGVFVDTNGTTSTMSGVLSGPGGLVKRDDGTLIIPSITADTYTGNTRVREGTLQLDGSITSNTFVEVAGTLTGTGTIFGNLENDGIVSPGHSPGTLFVVQNFTNHTDGTFIAEVGGLTEGVDSDLLVVFGAATIEGGTITVPRINNFNPVPGDRVTVISAVGGRTGTFDTFVPVGWLGLIQPRDDYSDPFTVDIVFELTSTFASQGLTRNEICVGENLDAAVLLVNDNEAAHNLIGIIGQIPPEELPEVFNLLAPEELASIYEISFQHGIMEMGNYRQRMGDLRAGARGYCGDLEAAPQPMVESRPDGKTVLDGKQVLPDKTVAPVEACPDKRWGMFATGYGQGINVDDDEFNNVHGYDIVTGGFSTGFDALVTRNFAIGIGGGYAQSTADLVNDGRVDAETGYVAAYATAFFGGFYVDAAATGGWSTYDTSRLGFGAFENGSTNGSEFNGIIGAGYDWKTHCWTIGPFATFHYTYVELDSFDEDGGSIAPLHFPEQSQDAERGAIGLKVAYDMTKDNIIFRPEVRAAFQHEFNNTDYAIDWSFRDISDEHICSVFGPSTGENSALIDAGFSLILGKCRNLSVYAFYSGNIGRDNDVRNGATGGLRLSF